MKQKCTTANGAVWRQAGCITADSFVGIWKFVSRPSLSEPPPERQAANPLASIVRNQNSIYNNYGIFAE